VRAIRAPLGGSRRHDWFRQPPISPRSVDLSFARQKTDRADLATERTLRTIDAVQ
jgi:hypothetical protein